MMAVRWLEKLETTIDEARCTGIDEQAERSALLARINTLEREVADLTEWLTALSEDVTINTGRTS
jgi:hypothetical protein